ncbi:MAG TPA: EamA family transporter [Gemmatimonadales bacterium]|jgi:drug/metabolite transporter (DMT)-like permease
MTHRRIESPMAFTALALSGVVWGTSFVLGKVALVQLSVPHMILYRFIFASIAFAPVLLRGMPRLDRNEWGLVAIAGVIGVPVQFLLQFEGLARTTASHAALMIGTAPVLVAVAAFVVLHERLHQRVWLALVVSTAGVALIVMRTGSGGAGALQPTLAGDLLVLASMFAAVVWILASKQLMVKHHPAVVSGLIAVTGTVPLAVWVLARNGPPPLHLTAQTWWATITLGVIATTCATVLWNWGLAHTDAGKAGAFINLEPVVGATLGVWLLHESLGPMALVGGAMIVAGALVAGASTT